MPHLVWCAGAISFDKGYYCASQLPERVIAIVFAYELTQKCEYGVRTSDEPLLEEDVIREWASFGLNVLQGVLKRAPLDKFKHELVDSAGEIAILELIARLPVLDLFNLVSPDLFG